MGEGWNIIQLQQQQWDSVVLLSLQCQTTLNIAPRSRAATFFLNAFTFDNRKVKVITGSVDKSLTWMSLSLATSKMQFHFL